jgi:hypothetical protein
VTRRLGIDAQGLHGGGVTIDVLALVEVERAGELLDVDDVRQILVGKRRMLNAPPAAACPPARNGIT